MTNASPNDPMGNRAETGLGTGADTLDNPAGSKAIETPHRPFTVVLHWLHAGIVISLLALGWYLSDLPKGPARSAAIGLHKSLGLIALSLILVRLSWLIWRSRHPAGEPPTYPGRTWEQTTARWVHRGLYFLLLAAPLSGFLSSSFTRYPMKFFGAELPRLFTPDEQMNAIFNALHKDCVLVLTGLLLLHLAGVAVHLHRREKILSRMRLFYKS